MSDSIAKIAIDQEPIDLNKLLKLDNVVSGGGEAKMQTIFNKTPPWGALDNVWVGDIYTFRYYGRALLDAEVAANYAAGKYGLAIPEPASSSLGKEVTIVSSGVNSPDTVYLSKNAKLLEQVPLDGVGTWIASPAPVRGEDGTVVVPRLTSGRLTRHRDGIDSADIGQTVIWPERIREELVAPAIEDLKLADFKRFRSNFIHVITGNPRAPVNWFDDKWWGAVCHNIGVIAKVAKEGGCKGILIDTEVYGPRPMWGYEQLKDPKVRGSLPEVYGKKSWEEVSAKVRQQGREFAHAINREFADPVIIFFNAAGSVAKQVNDPRWSSYEKAPLGLKGPFIDGLLEGSTDKTVIVDVTSYMKWRSSRSEFEEGRRLVEVDALSRSQVPGLYGKKVKVGFCFRLGYHPQEEKIQGHNLISGLFDPAFPETNFFSPEKLEDALKLALEIGDGYVLFWNYRANWWLDSVEARPADGAPLSQRSRWVPRVYWQALENARAAVVKPAQR